jgi:chaperonin GroES
MHAFFATVLVQHAVGVLRAEETKPALPLLKSLVPEADAFQIRATQPLRDGLARAPAASMQYRLNNYDLPNPPRALRDQVLVKLRRMDDRTTGGLLVPTGDAEKPKEGYVLTVGPGAVDGLTGKVMPVAVKEGDLCLLANLNGEKVTYDGENCMFIQSDQIIGCYEGGKMTIDDFRPTLDHVVLEIKEQEEMTTTGIALAGDSEDDDNVGVVAVVGPGDLLSTGETLPIALSPGENVLYEHNAGVKVKIGGKDYKVVRESDCLSVW